MSVTKTVDVKVPKRSGFDKSFKNLFTMPVGTLVPLLCDEVIPNTSVNLDVALNACLPPLASDCFMNCDVAVESFFVPTRLLYGGFSKWLTGEKVYNPTTQTTATVAGPVLTMNNGAIKASCAPGSLMDYLGYKFSSSDLTAVQTGTSSTAYYNPYPLLAYHRVYDDWYRNTLVQNPVFGPVVATGGTLTSSGLTSLGSLPYETFSGSTFPLYGTSTFFDGVNLNALRQRNFGTDYFTNATPSAQNGAAQKVSIVTTGATGDMTIAALRSANSLQMWLERNNLAGFRLQDYVKANYGANLSDGIAQRVMYLGSGRVNVYTKGIQATAQNDGQVQSISNNPFETIGATYGNAVCTGKISLIHGFTAQEPGYIFVMCSLVPKVTYSSGVLRQNLRYNAAGSQVDMANPLLQNTGNQPIYRGELNGADSVFQPAAVFGYTDKFADFMTREDELHGLVRDGESLAAFALQRSFTNGQSNIDSSFLTIPTTYLDQVAATTAGISRYGAWVDAYLDYKIAMPLAQFSIPSLQDPAYEHGKDVELRRGGSRID